VALSAEATPRLEAWLAPALGARAARVLGSERLGGGAIQENLGLELEVEGGPRQGRHALVLRTDAPSGIPVSWNRPQEFRILEAAFGAGVAAPEPWCLCEDPAVLGKSFYLMARARGEARGAKLVRDPTIQARGDTLAARLGGEIAKLHRLEPPVAGLDFIPVPDGPPARARVAEYRRHLDAMGLHEPVIEWALAWLARNEPESRRTCLVHGDYRTGNYLVHDGDLSAILDWEFAAFSDPHEDLGWMMMRYWRFGAESREAGGVGSRAALLDGYEASAGWPVDREEAVPYWEVMGAVRWAVIALMQAARHYRDREASLELALTAHVLPVLELDLLTRVAEIEGGRGR
jgi:aminoglycoside phosphotransferase (APT) family kinase protein